MGVGIMSMIQKSFKKGEVIVKEGDTGKSFFFILEGSASVYGGFGKSNQLKIGDIEAGEFFGEMAILEAYPRSATVVAKDGTRVVEIPGNEMKSFFEENPDMIFELMRHLAARIQVMTDDYNEAKVLLKDVNKAETPDQKKSLFSKIKKHIDIYQNSKNSDMGTMSFNKNFGSFADNGSSQTDTYNRGMVICKEDDDSKCMYVLHSGSVGIYRNYRERDEEKQSELTAVSFFGELGMINETPRTATAVAESDGTRIEELYLEDLESTFQSCPDKIIMILRHMSYRLRRLNTDFLEACKEITENYNS